MSSAECSECVSGDSNIKTPVTSVKELKAPAAEVGETLHITTVALWE